jgi:hypothetical protein
MRFSGDLREIARNVVGGFACPTAGVQRCNRPRPPPDEPTRYSRIVTRYCIDLLIQWYEYY